MTSILTGDIINSRKIATNIWMPLLKTALNSIGKTSKTWEIYRGDSFQIEVEKVEDALLFALKLKTIFKSIKNLDVRIAIGIGSKNNSYKNITEGSGEAFVNSGEAFDNLLKKQNLAIISPYKDFDKIINTTLALALLVMDNWTVNSAVFVDEYFKNTNVTQKVIAKNLHISESTASERRKRAGLDEILQLENLYRVLIKQKIKQ
ncbi:MAG: SatD family protein [Polaribacter sp.]